MRSIRLFFVILLLSLVFVMAADPVSLPYVQNFDTSEELPDGWTIINQTSGEWNSISPYWCYEFSEPNCLYYWSDDVQAGQYFMAASPEVNWGDYENPGFSFWSGSYYAEGPCFIEIGLMTDPWEIATYSPIDSFPLHEGYQFHSLSLADETEASRIVFRFLTQNGTEGMLLDNVTIAADYETLFYQSLPYHENFDGYNYLPPFWRPSVCAPEGQGLADMVYEMGNSWPNAVRLWSGTQTDTTFVAMLLPQYDSELYPQTTLSFKTRVPYEQALPHIGVGLMADPSDISTYTELAVFDCTIDWTYESFSLSIPMTRTGQNIAIRLIPTGDNQCIYIDDVLLLDGLPPEPLSLPYSMNFDEVDTPLPDRWSSSLNYDVEGSVYLSTEDPTSPPKHLTMWCDTQDGYDYDPSLCVILPEVNIEANPLMYLSFNAKYLVGTDEEEEEDRRLYGILYAGYLTDRYDPDSFYSMGRLDIPLTYTSFEVCIQYDYTSIVCPAIFFMPYRNNSGVFIDDVVLSAESQFFAPVSPPYFINFEETSMGSLPPRWSKIVESANSPGYVTVYGSGYSQPNALTIANSDVFDADDCIMAVGPTFTPDEFGGIPILFKGMCYLNSSPASLAVGYLTDRFDQSTFVPVDSIPLIQEYQDYQVIMPETIDAPEYVYPAFRLIPTTIYQECMIDNVFIGHGGSTELAGVPYHQDFDNSYEMTVPSGWRHILNSTDPAARISTTNEQQVSYWISQSMYNANDISASSDWFVIAPGLLTGELTTCMVEFMASAFGNVTETTDLVVGYITDRENPDTFVAIQTVHVGTEWTSYKVSLPTSLPRSPYFIALRFVPNAVEQTVCIDDFEIYERGIDAIPLPLTEGFNTTVFPAAGWSAEVSPWYDGEPFFWGTVESGDNPVCNPFEGTGMMCFGATEFTSARLILPPLDLTHAINPILEFSFLRSDLFAVPDYDWEGIIVQRRNGSDWRYLADTYYREDNSAVSPYWHTITLDLSQFVGYNYLELSLYFDHQSTAPFYIDNISVHDPILALEAPENVGIRVANDTIELTWTAVSNAESYRVLSAPSPSGEFIPDETGVFDGTKWTAPLPPTNRYYRVKATTDPAQAR